MRANTVGALRPRAASARRSAQQTRPEIKTPNDRSRKQNGRLPYDRQGDNRQRSRAVRNSRTAARGWCTRSQRPGLSPPPWTCWRRCRRPADTEPTSRRARRLDGLATTKTLLRAPQLVRRQADRLVTFFDISVSQADRPARYSQGCARSAEDACTPRKKVGVLINGQSKGEANQRPNAATKGPMRWARSSSRRRTRRPISRCPKSRSQRTSSS